MRGDPESGEPFGDSGAAAASLLSPRPCSSRINRKFSSAARIASRSSLSLCNSNVLPPPRRVADLSHLRIESGSGDGIASPPFMQSKKTISSIGSMWTLDCGACIHVFGVRSGNPKASRAGRRLNAIVTGNGWSPGGGGGGGGGGSVSTIHSRRGDGGVTGGGGGDADFCCCMRDDFGVGGGGDSRCLRGVIRAASPRRGVTEATRGGGGGGLRGVGFGDGIRGESFGPPSFETAVRLTLSSCFCMNGCSSFSMRERRLLRRSAVLSTRC